MDGNRLSAIANGVVKAPENLPMAERLQCIFSEVGKVIATHGPGECAIEETFVNKNPTSTLKLGHARAASMLAAAEAGLPVFEYTPNAVKKSVVGAGHADKDQVQAMVKMLLPGADAKTADAADALAVAICHAHHRATNVRMAEALKTQKIGGQAR